MTEITKKDYKTVEKEYSVTVCDVCGFEAGEAVTLAKDPVAQGHYEAEVVQEYDDKMQAKKEAKRFNEMETARKSSLARSYGVRKQFRTLSMECDVSLDVCKNCFESTFELPSDSEHTDVNFRDDGIEVVEKPLITSDVLDAWLFIGIIMLFILTIANVVIL